LQAEVARMLVAAEAADALDGRRCARERHQSVRGLQSSWFMVSMVIGFIAGVIAGLSLGLSKLLKSPDDFQLLLGIPAAGDTGTDFAKLSRHVSREG
jgi:hypothetical protein